MITSTTTRTLNMDCDCDHDGVIMKIRWNAILSKERDGRQQLLPPVTTSGPNPNTIQYMQKPLKKRVREKETQVHHCNLHLSLYIHNVVPVFQQDQNENEECGMCCCTTLCCCSARSKSDDPDRQAELAPAKRMRKGKIRERPCIK